MEDWQDATLPKVRNEAAKEKERTGSVMAKRDRKARRDANRLGNSEPQSTADLRILDEMCDDIEKHGVCALPGSLMSLVRTERGKRVAKLVEKLARDVSAEKWARQVEIEAAQRTLEAQQDTINSEREMNHQLTTELQRRPAVDVDGLAKVLDYVLEMRSHLCDDPRRTYVARDLAETAVEFIGKNGGRNA
jgi:hypothetical protein